MSSSSIIMRQYKGESDRQQLIDLFDACERFDKLESSIPISQLQLPSSNSEEEIRQRDLRLWEDAQGRLIGFGKVWIREPTADNVAGLMWFCVHPLARGGDIERQIITWAEERIGEVGREHQVLPKLAVGSRSTQADRIAILKDAGFTEDRHLVYLSRSLTEPISIPNLPEGFTIRCIDQSQDAEAWVELRNRCFIDHWNYHPRTLADYQHRLQAPDYMPELDLVIVAPEGKFACICYCTINTPHNDLTGRKEGWVKSLATSPDFRRQGLARAMLLHSLHRLKALNIDIAKLQFDAENHLGVGKLYESVGFGHLYTQIAYFKQL